MTDETGDEFDAEAWCNKQPPEAYIAFASHCAARTLPNIYGGHPTEGEFTGLSFDLLVLRATLTSAVAAFVPTADVIKAARGATRSTSSVALHSSSGAALHSAITAHSASSSIGSATTVARSASASAGARSYVAKQLDRNSDSTALWQRGLWLDTKIPEAVASDWQGLRAEWTAAPEMSFWVGWYDSILQGVTPDWDLWRDNVLIDDMYWKAGPEAVAAEIKRVQAALRDKRAEKFEDHIRSLKPRFSILAPQADCLSKSIEGAIQAINKELGQPNQTLDCMEPLYQVPQILKQISIELTASNTEDPRIKELSKLSQSLILTVSDLNERLKKANMNMPVLEKKRWHQANA